MNILFYLYRYPAFGGIETVTRLITEKLAISNHFKITVLSYTKQDSFTTLDNITLKTMPNPKNWESEENFIFAEKIIQNNKFDCIIFQDSYANIEKVICKLAKKYKIALYTFEHSTPLIAFKMSFKSSLFSFIGLRKRIGAIYNIFKSIKRRRYLLKYSKKYILLSAQFIPEFAKSALIFSKNKKLTYINNPISIHSDGENYKKENIILCVCQLVPEKSVNLMIDLWFKIHTKLPNWKFQIVGDGSERIVLENKVKNLNIPRVEFVGYSNPTEYYKHAKIFWMMSRFEGWGMTLVEAQQHGCIPIAYKSYSSISDIIEDSKNGFIIQDLDEKSFMEKTIFLANHEQERIQMETTAKDSVNRFDRNTISTNWLKLIEENNRTSN